ncbi:MAG: hypothetical protein KGQ77_00645 [Betaproteobacteria bacterium]|nr:hypothetical protein [Betaproteobacteria bacterium]
MKVACPGPRLRIGPVHAVQRGWGLVAQRRSARCAPSAHRTDAPRAFLARRARFSAVGPVQIVEA